MPSTPARHSLSLHTSVDAASNSQSSDLVSNGDGAPHIFSCGCLCPYQRLTCVLSLYSCPGLLHALQHVGVANTRAQDRGLPACQPDRHPSITGSNPQIATRRPQWLTRLGVLHLQLPTRRSPSSRRFPSTLCLEISCHCEMHSAQRDEHGCANQATRKPKEVKLCAEWGDNVWPHEFAETCMRRHAAARRTDSSRRGPDRRRYTGRRRRSTAHTTGAVTRRARKGGFTTLIAARGRGKGTMAGEGELRGA